MDRDELVGGRYRRVQVVGAGGMGEVWQGEDTLLQRTVAIKRILAHGLAADPTLPDRLLREARLAARLDHPYAVTVHDVVVENGLPHLVMQFAATLRYLLGGRPSGAVVPRWDGSRVTSWTVPDGRGGMTSVPSRADQ